MRRLMSGAILAGALLALPGCPEQDVNSEDYPDAWWLPKLDAAHADAALQVTDADIAADAAVPADASGDLPDVGAPDSPDADSPDAQ